MGEKAKPLNSALWRRAHDAADKVYKKHSAYKSGYIVKYYKDHGGKFATVRSRSKSVTGLKRWYKERWVNQHGTTGYLHRDDIYRPSVRVSKKTPTTWEELDKKQIKRASREKATKGRVHKFVRKK